MKEKLMILGDSYSTFKGYVAEGCAIYYSPAERPETDVRRVEETWWYQVCQKADLELVLNNSWSGSTICYTGYNNTDCSASSSFIYRFRRLIAEGFFEKNPIDKLFLFGGTNDSWADAPLGEEQYGHWQEADLYCVLPAICNLLQLLKQTLPKAQIYCLINTKLKPQIESCMLHACEKYGITPVTFEHIHKRCDHPTVAGMQDIAEQVLRAIGK